MTDLDRARRYDAWFEAGWGAYAFGVERAALRAALGPLEGLTALEVGCGTGRFTAELERAGARVVGLDPDPASLALAASRVEGPLLRGDAHRLPLPDRAVDLVVTVTATEFLADPVTALTEAVRVTRSGGRVAVAALNPASPWGLAHRRRLSRPPWDQACLRTPGELDALLGQVPGVAPRVAAGVLHAPAALPGLHRGGAWLERVGGRVAPRRGAFQIRVLTVG